MTSHEEAVSASENIKVVVRCRPLSDGELRKRYKSVVKVEKAAKTVTTIPPKSQCKLGSDHPRTFTFDDVFSPDSTQQEVYDVVAGPIVQNVLDGYNGTIFAYGQTGTGKTFTMEGSPELRGIIPNSFAQIFKSIAEASDGQRYLVRCSYLEIYNENIRDLLSKDQTQFLDLRENKDKEVYVKDLTSLVVVDADDMDRVMTVGNKNRSVASTNMNSVSSRSHAIFSIVVECSSSTDAGPSCEPSLRMGKLNLVDLAGSERVRKTLVTGDRLKEATKINLSLFTLGAVIHALVDGNSHIPYRDSKLTRLLQDSLGGNSKTVMIATVGPAGFNYDESVSTLRYASRAKNIRNCAKINEDPKDAILRKYQEEILHLRALLEQKKMQLQLSQDEKSAPSKSDRKKRSSLPNPTAATEEAMINSLLQEQKQMEQKYKDELKAMLEPYGIDPEASPQEIKDELEKRHAALVQDDNVGKQETERLLEELEQTTAAMRNSKRQCKELFHRIISLESEILHHEETNKKAKTKEKELAEQKIREKWLRKDLEEKQMTTNDLKTELKRLQEEIEKKRAKHFKWSSKLSDHDDDWVKFKRTHVEDMEQMMAFKVELTKEIKLKKLMVDNFIPRKILKQIELRIRYNEEADQYELGPRTDTTFERPPVNRMLVTPYLNLTNFSRLSRLNNVYFSNENLLAVEPDMPVPHSQELTFEKDDPMVENLIVEERRELNQDLVVVCDHRKGKLK